MTTFYPNIVNIYATAFFELCYKSNSNTQIYADIEKLQEDLKSKESIIKNIAAPIYQFRQQKNTLMALSEDLELSNFVRNLLVLLAQNKRLNYLNLILDKIGRLLKEKDGIKFVSITFAEMPEKSLLVKITDELKKLLNAEINLDYHLDKNIISGMIIKYDNKMLDASLKNKLRSIMNNFSKKIILINDGVE